MRRISRRAIGFAALCALILGVVLAGCSYNPMETPSVDEARQARLASMQPSLTANDLLTEGELTIGLMTGQGAPYVLETPDGYEGIDADVAAALAQNLGLRATFVPLNDSAAAALTRVDVIMGVTAEQAQGQVVVSDYVEQAVGFFTLGDAPTVASVEELNGQTVGLQENSASQQLLNRSNISMTQQGFENLDAAMEALKAGTVKYVLCPAYPGAYLAEEMGGIAFCGTLDVPTTQGVGVASGSQALIDAVQTTMDDIRDNGVLTIILRKWVGDLPRLTSESQVKGVVLSDAPVGAQTPAEGTANGSEAGSNAVAPEDAEGVESTEDIEAMDGTTDSSDYEDYSYDEESS